MVGVTLEHVGRLSKYIYGSSSRKGQDRLDLSFVIKLYILFWRFGHILFADKYIRLIMIIHYSFTFELSAFTLIFIWSESMLK